MLNFLYMIFIYPVYMFVEFIFFLANNITDDYIGFSIILLSITVNVICLPIYNVAEKWQEKERAIQKQLKSKITEIKAVFSEFFSVFQHVVAAKFSIGFFHKSSDFVKLIGRSKSLEFGFYHHFSFVVFKAEKIFFIVIKVSPDV